MRRTRRLRPHAAVLALLAACTRETTRGTATASAVPSATASVAASAAPSATALRTAPESTSEAAVACLAQHLAGTPVREGDGWALAMPDGARLLWDDGRAKSLEQRLDAPDLEDMLSVPYRAGPITPVTDPSHDPGRIRVDALFAAAYGAGEAEVRKRVAPWRWRGHSLPVHERALPAFERVGKRLDALVAADPSLLRFFAKPGGTLAFRTIAGTERTSAHAYGIAFDLDPSLAHYWRNDRGTPTWKNQVPQAIVDAFEAEQFVWGGRWYHFDTMHFEWRPELFACRAASAVPAATTPAPPEPPAAVPKPTYAFVGQGDAPEAKDDLLSRFPTPPEGFVRVPVDPGSFGAFLRTLPLAAPGTKLLAFDGRPLYDDGAHDAVAAIVAIDVGKADLQQCADSVIRMHAEWLWSRGEQKRAEYKTLSGLPLSFDRWTRGHRTHLEGSKLVEAPGAAPIPSPSHTQYRAWLDGVFAWANTASLARDTRPVSLAELAPGDFMVMEGVPFGHAVLVLDVAKAPDGRLALLLGQGYMPAQRFHVLRPQAASPWFVVDKDAKEIATPFWKPFPTSALRRFP
jgi:hypothetical protein